MKAPRPEGDDLHLAYVRTEDLPALRGWLDDRLRPAFERVRTDLTFDILFELASEDRMRFWVGSDRDGPLVVIAVGEQPDRTVEIFALAGRDLGRWLGPLLARFEGMAKAVGMRRILFRGRLGWARVVPGYQLIGRDGGTVAMERNL